MLLSKEGKRSRREEAPFCCKPDFHGRGLFQLLVGLGKIPWTLARSRKTYSGTPRRMSFLIWLEAIVWSDGQRKGGQGAGSGRTLAEGKTKIARTRFGIDKGRLLG